MTTTTTRPPWQLGLTLGLIGVAVGAAIGAGTGMWWMMGVLGGTFGAFAPLLRRRADRPTDR